MIGKEPMQGVDISDRMIVEGDNDVAIADPSTPHSSQNRENPAGDVTQQPQQRGKKACEEQADQ